MAVEGDRNENDLAQDNAGKERWDTWFLDDKILWIKRGGK